MMVVDLCPIVGNEQWCSGDTAHFDLMGASTFSLLDNTTIGVLHVETFQWIATPVTGNLKIRIKTSGGYPYYAPLQVYNTPYPIANIEVQVDGTTWIPGDRTTAGNANWFVFSNTTNLNGNPLSPPYVVRITDILGRQILDTVLYSDTIKAGVTIEGTAQFPLVAGTTPILTKSAPLSQTVKLANHTLQVEGASYPLDVEVVNIMGNHVAETSFKADGVWAVPRLSSGVYMIHAKGSNGETIFSSKFVW